MLSEISWTQKDKCFVVPLPWGISDNQAHRSEVDTVVFARSWRAAGAGGGWGEDSCASVGVKFQLCKMGKLRSAEQHSTYINNMMLCSSKTREGRSEVECSHHRSKTAKPKKLGRDFAGEDARGMHYHVAMMLHGHLSMATPTKLHAAYVQFFVY